MAYSGFQYNINGGQQQFDQFGLPIAGGAFSQFNTNTLAQAAANPNNPGNGQIPIAGYASNSFQNPQTATQQPTASSSTSISAPQLLNFGAKVGQQATGIGNGFTNAINSFGTNLGFSSGQPAIANTLEAAAGASFGNAATAATIANATEAGLGDAVSGFATASGATNLAAVNSLSDVAASSGSGIFGGATLSGVLGAAALGALGGGILAHAIGGNATGGSIGGAIGAGAGMAFGGSAAAALGLELGAFAGPVGAIVGGVGGALFGSMIGNKTPATSAAEGSLSLDDKGQISLASQGSKNAGQYAGYPTQIASAMNTQLQAAQKAMGLTFTPTSLRAGVNTLHSPSGSPGFIQVGGQTYGFTPGDAASQTTAVNSAIRTMAEQSGASDAQLQAYQNYLTNGLTSGGIEPTVPTNPNPTGNQNWNDFVNNYKASQNANAAPTTT